MGMDAELMNELISGAAQFGVKLDDKRIEKLDKFRELLKQWNRKINLTAIEEDRDIVIKHFIDSFTILPHIGASKKLIDVGTGAGFPGIPVKIARDDLDVTLVDSLGKRVTFLNSVIRELDLTGIKAVHARAEDTGISEEHREKYDVSTARAVAGLPVLLEYCLPLLKNGGMFIAMKGSDTGELEVSARALEILGGKIEGVSEITLPFYDMKRNIIIVKKFRQTPTKYPRKPGKPTKDPLI